MYYSVHPGILLFHYVPFLVLCAKSIADKYDFLYRFQCFAFQSLYNVRNYKNQFTKQNVGPNLLLGRTSIWANLLLGAYCTCCYLDTAHLCWCGCARYSPAHHQRCSSRFRSLLLRSTYHSCAREMLPTADPLG